MKDKNGVEIQVANEVDVPEPNFTDIHNHEFRGIVADILEEHGTVIVEDQDSDMFEIEGNRLEVVCDPPKP